MSFVRDSHSLNCFSTLRQGLLYGSGFKQWLHCQLGLEGIHPQTEEMFLYDDLEGRLRQVPVCSSSEPIIEDWEDVGKSC